MSHGLTINELLARKAARNQKFRSWLESHAPLIGGEEDDDDDNEPEPKPAGSGDDDDDDDDNPEPAGGGGNDEELKKLKADLAAATDRITKAEAAARKYKEDLRAAKNAAAQDQGNWEEVAKNAQAELEEVRQSVAALEQERDTAKGDLDSFQRQVRVTSIASRMGFKDPADARALLSPEDTGDDKAAERALRKLAESKNYLVDEQRATGRSMGNGGAATGLLTKEQMEAMSPEEITANWDVVQKSMSALRAPTPG